MVEDISSTYAKRMHQYNFWKEQLKQQKTDYKSIIKISGCLCYFYDNQRERLKIVITQWSLEYLMGTTDILSAFFNVLLYQDPNIPNFMQVPKIEV